MRIHACFPRGSPSWSDGDGLVALRLGVGVLDLLVQALVELEKCRTDVAVKLAKVRPDEQLAAVADADLGDVLAVLPDRTDQLVAVHVVVEIEVHLATAFTSCHYCHINHSWRGLSDRTWVL